MNTSAKKVLTALALITIIAPASLFGAPHRAHAQLVTVDPTNLIENAISAISNVETSLQSTISAVSDVTTAAATFAQKINDYVLQPIAFVTSGNLLKSMTAGILNFIGGGTNGTGQPQFVQNLLGHMQGVGDTQTRTFLDQFSTLSNSPFAPSIRSSLGRNYLQSTSLAGFFAKNQCTLDQSSPDIVAYAQGDWSKGGWSAWFSLTTQTQNNPFTLYQDSQAQLSTIVTDATTARLSELNWGQGFLSWCGSDSTLPSSTTAGDGTGTTQSTTAAPGSNNTGSNQSTEGTQSSSIVSNYTTSGGNAPGDACTNADGTPGTIKQPGSYIKDKLVQITGLEGLKLANMGNVGPEINNIIGNIGTVMNTIGTASSIFGDLSSGGLAGGGSSSSSNDQARAAYLGITENSIANNSFVADAWKEAAKNVDNFTAAWNSIRQNATVASTALTSLVAACDASHNFTRNNFAQTAAGYVIAAQQAQTVLVNPVFVQFEQASSTTATNYALIAKIKAEQNSTALGAGGAYGADVQALQAAPPSIADVVAAQTQAKSSVRRDVVASPAGSLNISGGTIFDRMNLVTINANAMATECVAARQTN